MGRTRCTESYTRQLSLAIPLVETIVYEKFRELGVLVRLVGPCHLHLLIVSPETIATVKTSRNNAIYD